MSIGRISAANFDPPTPVSNFGQTRAGKTGGGRDSRSNFGQQNQSVARVTTQTQSDTSSLKLSLKTAEGDTVEISIDTQSLRQSERGFAQGPGGKIREQSTSTSNSLTATVNVQGDLNQNELSDIQSLLSSLASGDQPQAGQSELDTISAYNFSYQQTHQESRSTVTLYG